MENILVINSFDYTGKFRANKNRVFTRPGPKAAVQDRESVYHISHSPAAFNRAISSRIFRFSSIASFTIL